MKSECYKTEQIILNKKFPHMKILRSFVVAGVKGDLNIVKFYVVPQAITKSFFAPAAVTEHGIILQRIGESARIFQIIWLTQRFKNKSLHLKMHKIQKIILYAHRSCVINHEGE